MEKHNTLITITCGTYFFILGFFIQSLEYCFGYAYFLLVGFTLFTQWFKNEIFKEYGRWCLYILVNIYVCFNVKPPKESTSFSYSNILLNWYLRPHGKKHPPQEVEDGYIWKRTLWYQRYVNDWTHINGRKHTTLPLL